MNPSPDFVFNALAFLAFSIPIVVALWKVFASLASMKAGIERQIEALKDDLVELRYQQQLKTQQIEALNDRLALSMNGVKELAEHIRTRTKLDSDRLIGRLDGVEGFLAKTTAYEPRLRG